MLRCVKYIVVHCTGTPPEIEAEFIRKNKPGRPRYHGLIDRFGYFMRLMGCNCIADNPCADNEVCYHLAYVGGIDRNGRAADTRNPLQWHRLYEKIEELKNLFPDAVVVGINFVNPQVEQGENPCFNVPRWLDIYRHQRDKWIDYEEQEDGTWLYMGESEGLLLPLKVFSSVRAIKSTSGPTN